LEKVGNWFAKNNIYGVPEAFQTRQEEDEKARMRGARVSPAWAAVAGREAAMRKMFALKMEESQGIFDPEKFRNDVASSMTIVGGNPDEQLDILSAIDRNPPAQMSKGTLGQRLNGLTPAEANEIKVGLINLKSLSFRRGPIGNRAKDILDTFLPTDPTTGAPIRTPGAGPNPFMPMGGSAASSPTQGGAGGGISVSGQGVSIGGPAGSGASTVLAKEIGEEVAKAQKRYGQIGGSTRESFSQPTPEEQKDLHYAQGLAKAQLGTLPYLKDSTISDIAQESYMGSTPGALAAKYAPKPNGTLDLIQASELTRQIESFQKQIPGFANIEENVGFSAKIKPENATKMKDDARRLINEFDKSFSEGNLPSSNDIDSSMEIVKVINPKWNIRMKPGSINTNDIRKDLERASKAARISEKLQNASKNMTPEQTEITRKVIARQQYEIDNMKGSLSDFTQQIEKSIDSPENINIQKQIQVNLHNIADVSSKNSLTGDKVAEISKNIMKEIQVRFKAGKQGMKIDDIFDEEDFRDSIVKQVESAVANVQSTVQNTVANQANTAAQNTPNTPTA
jgi:hypothetical protein